MGVSIKMSMKPQNGQAITTAAKLPDWMLTGDDGNMPSNYISAAGSRAAAWKRSGAIITNGGVQTRVFVDSATPVVPVDTYALQDADEIAGITKIRTRNTTLPTELVNARTHIDLITGRTLTGVTPTGNYSTVRSAVVTKFSDEFTSNIRPLLSKTKFLVGDPIITPVGQSVSSNTISSYTARSGAALDQDNRIMERGNEQSSMDTIMDYIYQEVEEGSYLHRAGVYQREYDQGRLEDLYRSFVFEDTWEAKRLEIIGNAVRTSMSTYSQSVKPYFRPSKGQAAIGGALTGAGIGGQIGAMPGGPFGAVAGVIGGALIGGILGNSVGEG